MKAANILVRSIFMGMVLSGPLSAQEPQPEPPPPPDSPLPAVTHWLCDFLRSNGFTRDGNGGKINKVEFSNGSLYLSGPSATGGRVSYSIPLKDINAGSLLPVPSAGSYESLAIDTLDARPSIIVWDSTLSGCEGKKAAAAEVLFRSHSESSLFVRGLKQAVALCAGKP